MVNTFSLLQDKIEQRKGKPKQSAGKDNIEKSPHYANEERDNLILEMRQAQKPFNEICDSINDQYPDELLDEKAAYMALKRHCKRLHIPYPYGKRGRKTDK